MLVPLWLAATAAGMAVLVDYELTPGAAGAAPARWPSAVSIEPSRERPTLVVAAHPRCSCTRASLAELGILLARTGGRLAAHVLFVQPPGRSDAWVRDSELYRSASALPGVAVHVDVGGRDAERFGALTSGAALLYGPAGELRFRGGLTGSRGHQGDNAGRAALTALAFGEAPERSETFVFGCALASRHLGNHGKDGETRRWKM